MKPARPTTSMQPSTKENKNTSSTESTATKPGLLKSMTLNNSTSGSKTSMSTVATSLKLLKHMFLKTWIHTPRSNSIKFKKMTTTCAHFKMDLSSFSTKVRCLPSILILLLSTLSSSLSTLSAQS